MRTPRRRFAGRKGAPRIAVIGCGAISELCHLPALAQIPGAIDNALLIDRNPDRTRLMASQFGVTQQATDLADVIDRIDGAIVAVPPALHYPIATQLLSHGVPVLCEKPLADSPAAAAEMVRLARALDVPLAINHTRRLLPAYTEVKRLVEAKAIGDIREICWEEGVKFDWPAASAFHFQSGARGVLLDMGIHSLDLVCWWLGRKPDVQVAATDSFGGPESMAELRLRSGECHVRLRISWLSPLANRYRIVGDAGTISGTLERWDRVTLTTPTGRQSTRRLRHEEREYNEFGLSLIRNFILVVRGEAEPLIPGEDVLPAVELMDECYSRATLMEMPWMQVQERREVARA